MIPPVNVCLPVNVAPATVPLMVVVVYTLPSVIVPSAREAGTMLMLGLPPISVSASCKVIAGVPGIPKPDPVANMLKNPALFNADI